MSSNSPIKKVVLAGATGNLGPVILNALLAANFTVTVLTRQSNAPPTVPSTVTVVSVDYDSQDSLIKALTGHDALISNLGDAAHASQLALITAASAAGIKRYIPSEFGSDVTKPATAALPVFGGKVAVQKALKEAVEKNLDFSYTLIINGAFLDWGLKKNFLIDLTGRKAFMVDGGKHEFSATLQADVGKAVVGVLNKPQETKNRAVYVHSVRTTLRQLVDVAKSVTGSEGWVEEEADGGKLRDGAMEVFGKHEPNPMPWIIPMLQVSLFGGEAYGQPSGKVDNELVGVEEMNDGELQELIQGIVDASGK